jgi:excisionase family DNA binding protein
MTEFLDVRGAAARLGLAPSAIYKLASMKQLASYRIGPNRGRLRFKSSDIDAYVERGRQGPKPLPEKKAEVYVPRHPM